MASLIVLINCMTLYCAPSSLAGWWFVSNGVDEGWGPCSYLENGGDEEEVAISSLGESW